MLTFKHSIGPDLRITFNERPCEAIRALLKGAGFRWSPAAGCWSRRGCKGAADFLAALDRKLNPDRPDGPCWDCQEPGRFRPQGAATPVYCDACYQRRKALESLKQETIKRPADECACDWCEQSIQAGEAVLVNLEQGTAYCSAACAEHDHFDRGNGPVCPGVSRW